MVYYGRAGLWDDFIVFQAKARKARLEAKNAHAQKINQRMHYAGLAVSCVLGCCRPVCLLYYNICDCEVAI
jgi:hypothetical protein